MSPNAQNERQEEFFDAVTHQTSRDLIRTEPRNEVYRFISNQGKPVVFAGRTQLELGFGGSKFISYPVELQDYGIFQLDLLKPAHPSTYSQKKKKVDISSHKDAIYAKLYEKLGGLPDDMKAWLEDANKEEDIDYLKLDIPQVIVRKMMNRIEKGSIKGLGNPSLWASSRNWVRR
jgi:hypothetical protein